LTFPPPEDALTIIGMKEAGTKITENETSNIFQGAFVLVSISKRVLWKKLLGLLEKDSEKCFVTYLTKYAADTGKLMRRLD
jgi:hypothetical protein